MTLPKVLIIGQPFNNFSGGGITLSNLFKGWPKDKIAVACTGQGLYNVTTDVCNTYYQLGKEEYKWIFPFNLVQKHFPSGIKSVETNVGMPIYYDQTGLRYFFVNRFFYPILSWIGLFHCVTKISISTKFKNWLSEFDPEVLYLQVTEYYEITFAKELINYLKIPSVIHVMDDWPSTISSKGLFKKFWSIKIDTEFKQLLNRVDLHLSISDAMSIEYMNRYNKNFKAFHNPIETEVWLTNREKSFVLNTEYITILYSGRIGIGITDSLYEVASAIDSTINEGINIKLHIQTPTKEPGILARLQRYKCVVINPFAALEQLPKIFSEADILLLANDFSVQGVDYLKFSMPTKASEYMISGTPVLVYSAEETAVSKFFSQNECGHCVPSQGPEEIIKALQFLIRNEEYRKKISSNAVKLAKELFDANRVRYEFQQLLINLAK
jgi:glycosyltransferase involved in cell wall biosynthesis